MAATCRGCGLKVGCGCSLRDGLCSGCYSKSLEKPAPPPPKPIKQWW